MLFLSTILRSILRRGQILNLVLARPRQRYDALRKFIDIEVVEKSENALKQKITEVQTEIDRLSATKVQQEENLNQLWDNYRIFDRCTGAGGFPGRHHRYRTTVGGLYGQRGRRLGQRQEAN